MGDDEFKVKPDWALGGVILTAVVTLGYVLRSAAGQLDVPVTVARIGVTTATGMWYAFRLHYTQRHGTATDPGYASTLVSGIVAVAGLSCFCTVERWYWFIPLSVVLALGMAKDLEVARFRTMTAADPALSAMQKGAATLVANHHYYSMVRDASMSFWWLIYGIVALGTTSTAQLFIVLLFGVPYSVLVVLWILLKGKTERAEQQLKGPV